MKYIEKHEILLNKKIHANIDVDFLGGSDASKKGGIASFTVQGVDPHTIAIMLDQTKNIMMRSGMHCAHSFFNARHMDGSARASLYLYNTEEEVDLFIDEMNKMLPMWKK
jgi:cysteine desulfurase/selenocysteine lyase